MQPTIGKLGTNGSEMELRPVIDIISIGIIENIKLEGAVPHRVPMRGALRKYRLLPGMYVWREYGAPGDSVPGHPMQRSRTAV
jgi:hypothetical protein